MKANIELLNRYSANEHMEPRRLRWQGKKYSFEGVLEANSKPVAVCAKGDETMEAGGDYVLYVAPGMDAYVACCVVMAVEDRTRRSSDDGYKGLGANLKPPSNGSGNEEIVWQEGYR